jgi:hypothetical protein
LFAAGRSGRTKCSVKFLTYIVCMHFCAHGGIDEKETSYSRVEVSESILTCT